MSGPRLSIIPARAATDRALKPRDLQVLCVLGRHTDDLGWCRRSQVKMADEMGCARSTVFEAIERLVKAGYLERHEQEHETGRDSAHVYRVILDPVHASVASVQDADGDGVSGPETPCRQAGTPAGISAPPAGPEPAPPAGPGPAPINDPYTTTPVERSERERGREEDSKAIERDFKRAYAAWPTFVSDSEPEARKAWWSLTADERTEAVTRQADYVSESLKAGGRKTICSYGRYLGERRWTKLAPKVEASQTGDGAPPDDYAPPFGPVWGAVRSKQLLTGMKAVPPGLTAIQRQLVADGTVAEDVMHRRNGARHGWPIVNEMHRRAMNGQGVPVGPKIRALEPMMEPVPVGSERFEEWRLEHELRGWPWIPDPGDMRVVYFPRGGPAGLDEFEAAIRSADGATGTGGRGGGDDAGRSEAAE